MAHPHVSPRPIYVQTIKGLADRNRRRRPTVSTAWLAPPRPKRKVSTTRLYFWLGTVSRLPPMQADITNPRSVRFNPVLEQLIGPQIPDLPVPR